MKLAVVVILTVFMGGCANTEHVVIDAKKSNTNNSVYSVVSLKDRAKIISAVVSNPNPKCTSDLEVARLDRVPSLQVYVDVKTGSVCK